MPPPAPTPIPVLPPVLQEEGLYLLVQELQRGLDEAGRRRGAATVLALFCKASKLDYQEHVPALITVGGGGGGPPPRLGSVCEGVLGLCRDGSCAALAADDAESLPLACSFLP